jgi:hypothetical protein
MEYAKCTNCYHLKYDYYCGRYNKVAPNKDKPTKCKNYKGKQKKKKKVTRKKKQPDEAKLTISKMVMRDRDITKFDKITKPTTIK